MVLSSVEFDSVLKRYVTLLIERFPAYLIYTATSRLTLHFFLIVSTSILLLVGAGLFSSACGRYQTYVYIHGVRSDVSEAGDGPGRYNVHGNVWHLVRGLYQLVIQFF